jgi:hypothetical protein
MSMTEDDKRDFTTALSVPLAMVILIWPVSYCYHLMPSSLVWWGFAYSFTIVIAAGYAWFFLSIKLQPFILRLL